MIDKYNMCENKKLMEKILNDNKDLYDKYRAFRNGIDNSKIHVSTDNGLSINSIDTFFVNTNIYGYDLFVKFLQKSTVIINLTYNHLVNADAVIIADVLKNNKDIKSVILSHNHISSNGMRALGEMLKVNTTIVNFVISDNYCDFCDNEIIHIIKALDYNKTLKLLNISCNTICNDDMIYLASILQTTNKTLCAIDLGKNFIDDKNIMLLAMALKANSTLKHLYLRANNIGNEGASELAEAILVNKGLLFVDLSDNKIGFWGIIEIIRATKINKIIKGIDLSCNRVCKFGESILNIYCKFLRKKINAEIII